METPAQGVWEKLQSGYMEKSLHNKLRLIEWLFTLPMTEWTSLQNHLDEFNDIIIDLKNLDELTKD